MDRRHEHSSDLELLAKLLRVACSDLVDLDSRRHGFLEVADDLFPNRHYTGCARFPLEFDVVVQKPFNRVRFGDTMSCPHVSLQQDRLRIRA